jgi:hypothetical protein
MALVLLYDMLLGYWWLLAQLLRPQTQQLATFVHP